jgi:hypothetical protein
MRFVLSIAVGICFCVLSTPMALADEVPRLNVAPLCHGIADQGADPLETGDPVVSFNQCIESEKNDQATVAKEWSQFSGESKRMCTDEATAGGESSYTDLLTCLEMARDVDNEESSRTSH